MMDDQNQPCTIGSAPVPNLFSFPVRSQMHDTC